jgi:signal transduction histidine kinase
VAEAGHIDDAAGGTLARLNEVLDAVRLQAGEALDLVVQPTDLVALAQRVAGTYQESTAHHHLVVQAAVPALVGQWDAFRLERVLENLLSNAVKYSPAGGEITVGVRGEALPGEVLPAQESGAGGWAVLTVRDQGLGIPAADLRRVFGRFQRGANVVGLLPGTGIGLAGARRIVAQHGGTIGVESVEGQGSTFTVRLPLHPPAARPT